MGSRKSLATSASSLLLVGPTSAFPSDENERGSVAAGLAPQILARNLPAGKTATSTFEYNEPFVSQESAVDSAASSGIATGGILPQQSTNRLSWVLESCYDLIDTASINILIQLVTHWAVPYICKTRRGYEVSVCRVIFKYP